MTGHQGQADAKPGLPDTGKELFFCFSLACFFDFFGSRTAPC